MCKLQVRRLITVVVQTVHYVFIVMLGALSTWQSYSDTKLGRSYRWCGAPCSVLPLDLLAAPTHRLSDVGPQTAADVATSFDSS